MQLSNFQENAAAGGIPATIHLMPLDAYPGETGASGTALAAARTSMAMTTSGSARQNSAQVEITANATGTARFVGAWDAASAGNFIGYAPLGTGQPQAFTLVDTTNDDFVSPGHGFVAGDEVYFLTEPSGKALPTGVTEGTVYYVIATGLATNSFRVSATLGGSSIAVTAVGSGLVTKISPQNVVSGNILRFAAGALTFTFF